MNILSCLSFYSFSLNFGLSFTSCIYMIVPHRFDIRTLHRTHVFRSDIEANFESNPVFTGITIVRAHLPIVQLNNCLTSSSKIQYDIATHNFSQSTE